jgi:hypothetical protein
MQMLLEMPAAKEARTAVALLENQGQSRPETAG